MEAQPILTEQEQKEARRRASRLIAYKKYYQKTCHIRDDMTEQEKQEVEQRMEKRRETSRKYMKAQKDLIATLKAQLNS